MLKRIYGPEFISAFEAQKAAHNTKDAAAEAQEQQTAKALVSRIEPGAMLTAEILLAGGGFRNAERLIGKIRRVYEVTASVHGN